MNGPTVPALMPLAQAGPIKQENNLSAAPASAPAMRSLSTPETSDESAPTPTDTKSSSEPQNIKNDSANADPSDPVPAAAAASSTAPTTAAVTSPAANSDGSSSVSSTTSSSASLSAAKDGIRHELLRPTQTMCLNCMTTNTPLWRRDENGQILCNACGLFLKLHGRRRPISLKTDVIKSRNRSRTAGQPRRFSRKPARAQQSDMPRQFVATQMPAQLVPAPSQPSATNATTHPSQAESVSSHTDSPAGSQLPSPPQATAAHHHLAPQVGQPSLSMPQVQQPPVSTVQPGNGQAPQPANPALLGQMRQPMHPLQMGPPAPVAGLSPALTAYNFYPTGTPILGPQPGLQPLSAMAQSMSPHFGPHPARPNSPPDLRLVRGHMSEQLLPRSPPERIAPLNHVSAADLPRPANPPPNMQDLQTKVSELEVINDLLRRRIADLEFSESRARKEAADSRAKLEELQNSLRQPSTPAEPNVLTPETSVAAPSSAPVPSPVSHPAPEPVVKEMKRIRVSELM